MLPRPNKVCPLFAMLFYQMVIVRVCSYFNNASLAPLFMCLHRYVFFIDNWAHKPSGVSCPFCHFIYCLYCVWCWEIQCIHWCPIPCYNSAYSCKITNQDSETKEKILIKLCGRYFKCILFKWSCTLNQISLKCVLIGPIDNKSVLALNSRQAIAWTNVSQDDWRRVRFAERLRWHVDKMSPSITGYNQIIPMPNVVRVESWIVVKLCV